MARRRDRHGRGIRGPLALPHTYYSRVVPLARPNRIDFFNSCVTQALAEVEAAVPGALNEIIVGVEDVPHLDIAWSGERIPLSAAVEPVDGKPAQIVIYERPLEHRASSRADLRRLVHRTIVEQLSAMTGRSIDELSGGKNWEDDF